MTAASVLGKRDPKSGQIAGHFDSQPQLKSRHSRTYVLAESGTPLGYLDHFAIAFTGKWRDLRYVTGSGSEWGASGSGHYGGAPLATAPCTVPQLSRTRICKPP